MLLDLGVFDHLDLERVQDEHFDVVKVLEPAIQPLFSTQTLKLSSFLNLATIDFNSFDQFGDDCDLGVRNDVLSVFDGLHRLVPADHHDSDGREAHNVGDGATWYLRLGFIDSLPNEFLLHFRLRLIWLLNDYNRFLSFDDFKLEASFKLKLLHPFVLIRQQNKDVPVAEIDRPNRVSIDHQSILHLVINDNAP